MSELFFYVKLGLEHVMDFGAYDHLLFLAALVIPFSFSQWRQVLLLVTIFTIAHCTSLALSVYNLISVDEELVEKLIPITIILTAGFNLILARKPEIIKNMWLHGAATAFFGIIHGLGFSNYFHMLMAGQDHIFYPLLGFATGLELAQVCIVLSVLLVSLLVLSIGGGRTSKFIIISSILVVLGTIPLLWTAFS